MSKPAKATFVWEDPLDLEHVLSEDERLIRDTARAYAQDKLMPRVLRAFRNETFEPAIFREMGELGLLGPTIPTEYGGAGLSAFAFAVVVEAARILTHSIIA